MYHHIKYTCYEPICYQWKQADQFQNWLCARSSVQGDLNVWMSGAKNCHSFLQEGLAFPPGS